MSINRSNFPWILGAVAVAGAGWWWWYRQRESAGQAQAEDQGARVEDEITITPNEPDQNLIHFPGR